MTEATSIAAANPERLTWAEICRRHPDEWVVLVETEWVNDTDFDFTSTIVFGHRKCRQEASLDVKAAFRNHDGVGSFFTGPIRAPIPRFVLRNLAEAHGNRTLVNARRNTNDRAALQRSRDVRAVRRPS